MKTIAFRWLALVAMLLPIVSHASTPAQIDAWKAAFPTATSSDSAALRKMITDYQLAVNRVTASAPKTLALLKDKLTRDRSSLNNLIHPAKPNPKVTATMRADAEAASQWLEEKFAPYFAKAP